MAHATGSTGHRELLHDVLRAVAGTPAGTFVLRDVRPGGRGVAQTRIRRTDTAILSGAEQRELASALAAGLIEPTGEVDRSLTLSALGRAELDGPAESPQCIDQGERCAGTVQDREALSGTGKRFPRCDAHWEARLATEQRLRQDYPDTDTPPEWFDPTAAGEHWGYDY